MTTSYILERQEDLKAHKKMMREAEKAAVEKMEEEKELRQAANEARIKAKVDRIVRGNAPPVKASVSVQAPKATEVEVCRGKARSLKLSQKCLSKKKPVIEESSDASEEG